MSSFIILRFICIVVITTYIQFASSYIHSSALPSHIAKHGSKWCSRCISSNRYTISSKIVEFQALKMTANTDTNIPLTPVDITVSPIETIDRSSIINIKLDNIKNMRDIATSIDSNRITPLQVFRTGCISKASDSDVKCIIDSLKVKSLIDLRSQAEIDEDEHINADIYNGFQSYAYNKKTRTFNADTGKATTATTAIASTAMSTGVEKKRYFISLMSESLIKKGVFFRLRKRIRVKSVLLYLLGMISRRAEKKVRNIFIDTINSGGLSLLNELVIDASSKEIIDVLKLLSNKDNFPIGMYCTAGKDRTGLITMLTLSILGATDDEILADYVLSDSAYSQINDKKAMVASLKQVDVNPDVFLRAKPQVMIDTMQYLRKEFGSINAYLDEYGFDESWRKLMRDTLLSKST